jgi:hypothetical protein
MIEITEPLEGSQIGYVTKHNLNIDGKYAGRVEVGYMTKSDVKAFKKYAKRKVKEGQPFGVQIFIDSVKRNSVENLGREKLVEIVQATKSKFSRLEAKDINLIEIDKDGNKVIIGKGSAYE